MPDPERDERRREREISKIRARKPNRATYDLPPELRRRMKELAEEERLPASQLVTLALLRFLQDWEENAVPLSGYKQPSRSPRYAWNLHFPAELLAPLKRRGRQPR